MKATTDAAVALPALLARAAPAAVAALALRAVLARGVRSPRAFYFWLAALLCALAWAATRARRGAAEGFEDSAATPVDQTGDTILAKLASIPEQIRDTITPSLDKLIASVSEVPEGDLMQEYDYQEDPEVLAKDGSVDERKFKALTQRYVAVDQLLSKLEKYDKATYDLVIKRAGAAQQAQQEQSQDP